MDHFNYNMQSYSPVTQPLYLNELDDTIKKDFNGHLLFKASLYETNYVDLKAMVDNINYLQQKIEQPNSIIEMKFDLLEEKIDQLTEENDQLKQRIATLEMLLQEN